MCATAKDYSMLLHLTKSFSNDNYVYVLEANKQYKADTAYNTVL